MCNGSTEELGTVTERWRVPKTIQWYVCMYACIALGNRVLGQQRVLSTAYAFVLCQVVENMVVSWQFLIPVASWRNLILGHLPVHQPGVVWVQSWSNSMALSPSQLHRIHSLQGIASGWPLLVSKPQWRVCYTIKTEFISMVYCWKHLDTSTAVRDGMSLRKLLGYSFESQSPDA